MIRLGVLGLGAVGRRVAEAAHRDPRFSYAGAIVRGVSVGALASSGRLFAWSEADLPNLLDAGVKLAGLADDLLIDCDVLIDCGQSGSAHGRLTTYDRYGLPVVFCGGERSAQLGPLTMPGLVANDCTRFRVPSCNTTAMARVLLPLVDLHGPISGIATVMKCATDADKARKGAASGAVSSCQASHHGEDLADLNRDLNVSTASYSMPYVTGHVIDLTIFDGPGLSEVQTALTQQPLLLLQHDSQLNSLAWRQMCQAKGLGADTRVRVWLNRGGSHLRMTLHLDNEAITVPELLDVAVVAATREQVSSHALR